MGFRIVISIAGFLMVMAIMLKAEVPDAVAPPILAVLAYGLWKFVRTAAPEN